jgi:aspartate racemase
MNRRDLLGLCAALGGLSVTGRASAAPAARTSERSEHRGLKTIGVLGGIGPQATMDLETRIHAAAQRLIPRRLNSGYPPMVVYYHRQAPFAVNEDASPRFPLQPHPQLLDAACRLGAWADFLVISSNGAHLIQEEIERASGRTVLSMVKVTIDEVRRRGWRRVGIAGLGNPIVYAVPLADLQIVTLDDERRARLDREVMKVMEGRDTLESTVIAGDAIASLRGREVDGIILGCTEVSLLLREGPPTLDCIDPAELLAEAAVKLAMSS